ncbi:hypothetical protein K503DRAFT_786346 [Rhizopogon vinicolor AM-OR11-026]|uniref:Uncharacterized protein n=1 Tax=Rhizopogon vinicolor AM-OR11-026 TaxID=1314800 RepID=A0A1B7MM22_9AGAM|nr:hypothetical protein K503DRAFT_786346 [Rhizopogon vinicolor AM-OR11-026]
MAQLYEKQRSRKGRRDKREDSRDAKAFASLTKSNFRDSLVERSLQLMNGFTIAPVMNEFHFNGAFLSLASNIGLFAGALFCGLGCDIWGRRISDSWLWAICYFLQGGFAFFGLAGEFEALATAKF